MWTFLFAVVLAQEKLELFFGDIDDVCWPEGSIYNIFETIAATADYAAFYTDDQITLKNINVHFTHIPGCSMVEGKQTRSVISLLRNARSLENSTAGYSVFLGPRLRSNCHFISDWIADATVEDEAHRSLYQISYVCQDFESFRYAETFLASQTGARVHIISFAVNIKDATLSHALEIFLRQKGWRTIVVLYETSPLVLQYRELAKNLQFYLSRTEPDRKGLNVVTIHKLQLDSDHREIVERFCNPCQAIVLLGGLLISHNFLEMVNNMSIFENSETAIIQVDPANVITYDALRFWRYILSENRILGAAAQCTFLMAALPVGQGFDISAYILETQIQVSLATAVALAIRLTYANYIEGDGVPPANRGFFDPLMEGSFSVPVLPNLTYRFSNDDGEAIEHYDFYFFTFKPAISAAATSISTLDFQEIFELNSVLLFPKRILTIVNHKVWPNPSRHLQRDYCLLSPCFQGIAMTTKTTHLFISKAF
ncbi:unnamed protein product [Dibothriocephalus latus]|uniref:Receptor ligand binding region domain-containing protein n=1 Tax=Dibothriocephalus latus TaxID=60516 RepID=A0A3P7NTG9_DIBLA|nr:unnamed protein product [Dibothriocephalus latus]